MLVVLIENGRKRERRGGGGVPDIVTYNTLINAYCHEGLLDEAFTMLS